MADNNPFEPTQNFGGEPREAPDKPGVAPQQGGPLSHPQRIGRYRVVRLLGQGGFGLVYLARDEQLDRSVAVKVPHASLISKAEDAEAYLTEARTVARLDHPNIAPVHDVGSTDTFPCFIVSKYVDGTDLSARLKLSRLHHTEAAELAATVAEALHYAHKQGLVHRDVKPGNILIGTDGRPYVTDFGLALKDEDLGLGPNIAGTPAYMSPEQARGQGHLVDGRSDIFSLGVVFYELLTGRRPFRGTSNAQLLEQIKSIDPRPLRQIDDTLPRELERICLNSLEKRAKDRYTTALDFADDLRSFLGGVPQHERASPTARGPASFVVTIGVVLRDNKVLMVRRRQKEGQLLWQFPAGIVKPFEDPEQKVIEEIQCETGVSSNVVRKLGERITPGTRVHAVYWHCRYLHGEMQNLDSQENSEVAWIPANQVSHYVTSDLFEPVESLLNDISRAGRTAPSRERDSEANQNDDSHDTTDRVAVAVVADQGRFILVRRSERTGDLLWQFPSGKIQDGESEEQAIEREVREEVGVSCKAVTRLGQRVDPNGQHVLLCYWACRYVSGTPRVNSPREIGEAKWMSADEVLRHITSNIFRPVREFILNPTG